MHIELVSSLNGHKLDKWKSLISSTGLSGNLTPSRTLLIWEDSELIATGSREKNILKYLAVSSDHQGEDLLSRILTELRRDAFEEGYRHLFLYTKPSNKFIFSQLFFYPIAQTDSVLFMENKRNGIKDFLNGFPASDSSGATGALVMNCNPFTLGHLHVISKASQECDKVYVFVLSEESDGFSSHDRIEMVKQGTAHLQNVTVLETGPYLISSATFPTYFLKDRDNAENVFCDIDIEIFLKYFVPRFSITRRYVGSEPFSALTDRYNEALRSKLTGSGVEFIQIERKKHCDVAISASAVREHIKNGNSHLIRDLVPQTTYNYLINNNLI